MVGMKDESELCDEEMKGKGVIYNDDILHNINFFSNLVYANRTEIFSHLNAPEIEKVNYGVGESTGNSIIKKFQILKNG